MPEISIITVGFNTPKVPAKITRTPWGNADHVKTLTEGVIEVGTPTHGGIGVRHDVAKAKLSTHARAEAINEYGHLWFEEDCDWAIVCNEMPELFSERHRELAAESLERWNKTYLEASTGKEA